MHHAPLPQSPLSASYERSRQYGVRPDFVENDILTDRALMHRQKQLQPLLDMAETVLKPLYSLLEQQSFMMFIADVDGYILSAWGKSPFTERARTVSLSTGANWHERVKGTNAIGTALLENKPVSVVGEEHYCYENHFLTCYAAPLYSSTNDLLGVLDISGDARAHHPHTLGMVAAAAMACQSHLLLQEAKRELTLTLHEADALVHSSHQPLISVDGEGKITRMNQAAARLFDIDASRYIGRPLELLLGKRYTSDILSMTQGDVAEIMLKKQANPHVEEPWLVRALRDERNRVFRTILTATTPDRPASPVHQPATATDRPGPTAARSANTVDWPGTTADQPPSVGLPQIGDEPARPIIARCPKIQHVFALIRHMAPTNATVLIRGETGTGKEIAARELHRLSGRQGPFIVVNCGAIPETLIESELFGYETGAFTGARHKGQVGKIEAAHQGTLFLDEIGELPLASQAVLLRVLEEKRVTRIGSHTSRPVDVRIVAATNRDLYQEVRRKRFRADLYFRLNEMEIVLPPLRERSDLEAFIHHFLRDIAAELGNPHLFISPDAIHQLRQYHWPGNIRQLRHVIRQAAYRVHLMRRPQIGPDDIHLPEEEDQTVEPSTAAADTLVTTADEPMHEAEVIARALRQTNGNVSQAAKLLRMGRTTLYRKMKQYPELRHIRNQK